MPSAADIFDGERDRKQTFLNDIWVPALCAVTGFGAACFLNWSTRRPVFSGDVTSSKYSLPRMNNLQNFGSSHPTIPDVEWFFSLTILLKLFTLRRHPKAFAVFRCGWANGQNG